jgi:hypothetical protein
MQCKPVTELPADEFDGYRCIAVERKREVALLSRNVKVLNKRLPKLVEALASLKGDFVLDAGSSGLFLRLRSAQQDGEPLLSFSIEHRRELLGENACSARRPAAPLAAVASAIATGS